MKEIITIERHILEQQQRFPHARGQFTQLMYDIALWAKLIAAQVRRAGLTDILGLAGTTNIQGEAQQKLDVYAHETIVRTMNHTGRLCTMASEEHPDPIPVPEDYPCGDYVLLFDPLDGSSNIDYNISTGTIFAIYRRTGAEGARGGLDDLLQPGHRQVAAGYVIYGSSTMLVYTAGAGVHGFTLDPSFGEFLLSHPNIRIPDKGMYYSANQGNERYWTEGVKRYMLHLTGHDPDNLREPLSQRYAGALVADFHRTLLSGGIFLYPADAKNPAKPMGKLRLCYECAPLALIAEQAGGGASDGVNPILHIKPGSLHQRSPLFTGSRALVQQAEAHIRHHDTAWLAQYEKRVALAPPG